MKKIILAAASSLALAVSSAAIAQQKTGPNGGMLAGSDGHQTELVVSPAEIAVFLFDDGKPHSTKGAVVKAVVQDGGKVTNVDLKEVDGKKLVGKLTAPLGKGAILVLTGKNDHGHAVSSRYVIN